MTPAQNTTAYIQGFEDGKRASVRLIEEAVAAEREACAKVATEHAAKYKPGGSLHPMMNIDITRAATAACEHIAHLISERGQA